MLKKRGGLAGFYGVVSGVERSAAKPQPKNQERPADLTVRGLRARISADLKTNLPSTVIGSVQLIFVIGEEKGIQEIMKSGLRC